MNFREKLENHPRNPSTSTEVEKQLFEYVDELCDDDDLNDVIDILKTTMFVGDTSTKVCAILATYGYVVLHERCLEAKRKREISKTN